MRFIEEEKLAQSSEHIGTFVVIRRSIRYVNHGRTRLCRWDIGRELKSVSRPAQIVAAVCLPAAQCVGPPKRCCHLCGTRFPHLICERSPYSCILQSPDWSRNLATHIFCPHMWASYPDLFQDASTYMPLYTPAGEKMEL